MTLSNDLFQLIQVLVCNVGQCKTSVGLATGVLNSNIVNESSLAEVTECTVVEGAFSWASVPKNSSSSKNMNDPAYRDQMNESLRITT